MKITTRLLGAALAATTWTAAQAAPAYPDHPIRMVIGYAAGGPTDVIGRIVAKGMGDDLGQPFVIDNKAGANAMIATRAVINDKPDGYSVLFSPIAYTINPLISPSLAKYDARTAMAPVALVATLPLLMITAADSPYNSAEELIAAAKAKPGSISFGSSGNGSSPHLATTLLNMATGTKMIHVSFKGNAPAMAEVMAGRVDFMFYPMVGIAPMVEQKKLKVLAVGSTKESPEFPGVPTVNAALGIKGFEHTAPWVGLLAPKGTPPTVVERLNMAAIHTLAQPETRKQLQDMGAEVAGGTAADFSRFLVSDSERWAKIIKAGGLKVQ